MVKLVDRTEIWEDRRCWVRLKHKGSEEQQQTGCLTVRLAQYWQLQAGHSQHPPAGWELTGLADGGEVLSGISLLVRDLEGGDRQPQWYNCLLRSRWGLGEVTMTGTEPLPACSLVCCEASVHSPLTLQSSHHWLYTTGLYFGYKDAGICPGKALGCS